MRRVEPSRLRRWTDARVKLEWDDLVAAVNRAGWKSVDDLPPVYAWNYYALRTEIALRFGQLRLF